MNNINMQPPMSQPIVGLDPSIIDSIKLVVDILTKGGNVADGVALKADKELNIKVSLTDGGVKVDFLAPEPVATVTKIITISDSVDYIKILTSGKLLIKVRGWAFEIPVAL